MSIKPISLVIPCRNEADCIATLLDEVFFQLGPHLAEVIVVDDGSGDATLAVLEAMSRAEPRLMILTHAASAGQSSAVRTGVRAAESAWVATIDGDGQNPPDEVAALVAALLRTDERFHTRVERLLEIDGEVVSSSHIRGLVLGGALEYAGQLLGDPFTLAGAVAHGDERGRTLGYPTANIVPDPRYVTPAHGVYAARATTSAGEVYPAAVSIGVRPTFVTGRGELIEAYLLDFSGDLYDTRLQLAFLKRLRGEKRFDSVDALVKQMARDVQDARAICARVA